MLWFVLLNCGASARVDDPFLPHNQTRCVLEGHNASACTDFGAFNFSTCLSTHFRYPALPRLPTAAASCLLASGCLPLYDVQPCVGPGGFNLTTLQFNRSACLHLFGAANVTLPPNATGCEGMNATEAVVDEDTGGKDDDEEEEEGEVVEEEEGLPRFSPCVGAQDQERLRWLGTVKRTNTLPWAELLLGCYAFSGRAGWIRTTRYSRGEAMGHWSPCHCLGCLSQPPPKVADSRCLWPSRRLDFLSSFQSYVHFMVTAVSPNDGPVTGGTAVAVCGFGLNSVLQAPSWQRDSSPQLATARHPTPPHACWAGTHEFWVALRPLEEQPCCSGPDERPRHSLDQHCECIAVAIRLSAHERKCQPPAVPLQRRRPHEGRASIPQHSPIHHPTFHPTTHPPSLHPTTALPQLHHRPSSTPPPTTLPQLHRHSSTPPTALPQLHHHPSSRSCQPSS